MSSNVAPEGWNLSEYKEFKYIDDDTESECSEYSYFEEYSSSVIKKPQKKFNSVMTKEEFDPE
jgi:hypothetical protein